MNEIKPVMRPDGGVEEFFIRINGSVQNCEVCGANVFHKPDSTRLQRFKCNGCGAEYDTE